MRTLIFLLCYALLLGGCSAKKPEQHLLFLVHSKSGHIELDARNPKKGTLVLQNVNKSVAFFSEGPQRKAGTLSTQEFVSRWVKSLPKSPKTPLNAGFVYFEKSFKNYKEIDLTLSDPQYDKQKDRFTFVVQGREGKTLSKIKELKEVTLFVDIDPEHIYPNKLESGPIGGFKEPKIDARKLLCIELIQCSLRTTRIVDFRQLSIPSLGQRSNLFGYVD
ncbi:MAG: hypothetical protein ACKVOH_03955 [Chlamydiales bacterium]